MDNLITIHANPFVEWQKKRANAMAIGLRRLGFKAELTRSTERISDAPAVLFGTTFWRQIERAPGDWLLVDRASFGDPDYVSLVWNGHGQRGKHCIPHHWDASRWQAHGIELQESRGGRIGVLCGQTEPYTNLFASVEEWYQTVYAATHFRPHPAGQAWDMLPVWSTWQGVGECFTLNSSVAIDALIAGVPVVHVDDAGGMAFHHANFESRERFFEWLAWSQWSWDEIQNGGPVEHLFRWLMN